MAVQISFAEWIANGESWKMGFFGILQTRIYKNLL